MIASQADCMNVGNMLGDAPLLGKKSLEFEIWREAVEVWVARGGADPALANLGAALRELRRDYTPVPCPVSISDSYLAAFLAGFASAEAHFGASPSFVINLRADDGPLLELFQDRFALGHLADVKPAGRSLAALSWRVGRLSGMRRLVELFDRYPPRGRAAGVYTAWRELVRLEPRTGGARRALAAEVCRSRSFRPELGEFTRPVRRERSQARCLEALHSWASTLEGSGTSGEYDEWRRTVAPGAPNRNTVAAAFGSWRAALVAAGLSCARAQPPDRHAKVRATRSSARAAQLVKRRNLVLDTVTACVADLGREPRAGEFLRWRLHEAPESPCQMTLYRAFPQGFAEVLVELRARSARQLRVQLDRLHCRQGLRYRAAFLRRLGVLLEVVVVDSVH
jgi:Homing endonuclease associated repeat